MLDLSTIPPTVLLARGQYSTVRSAHEDCKKELSMLVGRLTAVASQILRKLQPNDGEVVEGVEDLLMSGRWTIDEIEKTAAMIETLAKQKADLKPLAWPK